MVPRMGNETLRPLGVATGYVIPTYTHRAVYKINIREMVEVSVQ